MATNDLFKPTGNTEFDDFMNLITEIVAMPDEALNAERVEATVGAMRGSITAKAREQVVIELSKAMAASPDEDVVSLLRQSAEEIIEELDGVSNEKQTLIREIFNILAELAEEAATRVGIYDTVIEFELAKEGAKLPTYAHDTDAGCDIYAPEDITIPAGALGFKVDTGLKMAMKPGWAMLIYPRSGMSMKTGLRISNSIGLIDCSYRDSVGVLFDNFAKEDYTIHAGDRIAQFVLTPVHQFKGNVVESVANIGENRNGGFGSSGN